MMVINLFGGPGIGKSTLAAGLFERMKIAGFNVELVNEYAKDMVWEQRNNILDDQLYILAKQNRKLLRLLDHKIDYAITDSPLLLGVVYANKVVASYYDLVDKTFNSYNNFNIILKRDISKEYQPDGRVQKSLIEAITIDNKIEQYVNKYYDSIEFDMKEYDPWKIIKEVTKGQ